MGHHNNYHFGEKTKSDVCMNKPPRIDTAFGDSGSTGALGFNLEVLVKFSIDRNGVRINTA